MKHYITENSNKYLIRGPWTAIEIRQHWKSFIKKYPDTRISMEQWLVQFGKVYFQVERKYR